jgi:hypothetical protein
MSKDKISDYSETPGNNTDIGGINIAEGMLPSDVNNAIREQMAQLKKFQSGTSGESVTFVTANVTTANAGQVNVDNLRLDGNTLSSTNTNGNVELTPNGNGRVTTSALSATSPRVITAINDTNGNELFGVTATGSAVNEFTVANAATGNAPTLSATGSDTNIGMALTPKGTGGVIFPAGAVGTPAITTTGDLNTGIFFPAADTIAFTEGGVEAMRIDSSGNVGIGTSSPASKLSVATGTTLSNINNVTGFYVSTDNPSSAATAGLFGADDNIGGPILSGNKSRGTSASPTAANADDSMFSITGSAWDTTTSSGYKLGAGISFRRGSGTGGVRVPGYIIFSTSSDASTFAERMRIDSSGNVGIGTSSPGAKLHVYATGDFTSETNAPFTLGDTVTNGMRLYAGVENTNDYCYIGSVRSGSAYRPLVMQPNGGQFFIGTTGAFQSTEALAVQNNSNTVIYAKQIGGASTWCQKDWNNATSGDNRFIEFLTETSATARGFIDYNRGSSVVRYNTSSDATLKNIIGDSDGAKSVEILNSTRIREFAWKDDPAQKPQIGVIAQELYETYRGAVSVGGDYEETIPAVTEQRLVSEAVLDEDGNEIEAAVYETVEVEPERTETKYCPWGVDKTAFTFHLVAGWQAHEKLIKQQAETIAALEARIAALESKE